MSWDEKWTWGHPDFYIFFVSYHDLNGEMHLTAEPTRDLVWMPLRRGVEEPRIGSSQVNMPPAPDDRTLTEARGKKRIARDSHCQSDHFVLCRPADLHGLSQRNQRSAVGNLFRCRVWVSGSGVRVLSAVWLAYVYVSSEFESRSQHQVCPRCLGCAVGATLPGSTLQQREQLQDWGQGQRAGTPVR